MKATSALIGATAIFSLTAFSQLKAGTIELPLYGFKIEALDAPAPPTPQAALLMFLPATEGFSPNTNVQIQPYAGSIKDYSATTRHQFDELKWKIISENQSGDNEWAVEYAGPSQGLDLHFYARAISKDGKVYVVTATAKESQWANVSDALRKNVDSFKTL